MGPVPRAIGSLAIAGATLLGIKALAGRRNRAEFAGASIVITGGSRGLGLILARQLGAEGARLTLLARDQDDLARARAELESEGADVLTIACDVADGAAVDDAVARIVRERGTIDVLINNAGVMQVGPVEHMLPSDFEKAMGVHFWGPLHTMLAVIPIMRQQGRGRIVNIASVGGLVAVPHMAPYCASKFALVGLSEGMQAELRRHGIRVTTVCPGVMRTGSYRRVELKGKHQSELGWFGMAASAPLLSLDAERAARRILRACRRAKPMAYVGMPARALIYGHALAPNLAARAAALATALLPKPTGASGDETRAPDPARSRWAGTLLTRLSDRAAAKNRELAERATPP